MDGSTQKQDACAVKAGYCFEYSLQAPKLSFRANLELCHLQVQDPRWPKRLWERGNKDELFNPSSSVTTVRQDTELSCDPFKVIKRFILRVVKVWNFFSQDAMNANFLFNLFRGDDRVF